MSAFTVVIIIWAFYQLFLLVIKKKGMQQMPQGISRGTWREQLKQALENRPYQAGALESTEPKDEETKDYYVEPEGTQGNVGTQGIEGILGAEAYKNPEETPSVEMDRNPSGLRGVRLCLTERELVQGVMWAEILGKPRAMHPYRGPRT